MNTLRPIQQLPPSLVNRIAAGEVIERPAAVVKELVENALDAGATQIAVEVEDGGRALIRVIDNGGGIPPAELPLAFASHATSKLTCDDDLFRIVTMGFRGEALASIGAVSHARILSRTAGENAAYEIHNRGGAISDPQAAAGNPGTTTEVRNLFFNTPARRKFIKGSATEFGHISEMLLRLALPHPSIAFTLSHNNRKSFDLSPCSQEGRLLEAWPKEFRDSRLAIDVRDAELRLSGIIGLPELCKPTAKYQYFYLNGRYVRDRFVQHALRESYRGLSEPGRQPAAVLLLEIPPQDVDVNVHPTKIEVRFRDSGRIHGLVHSVVREKLLGSDLAPTAIPMRSDAGDTPRQELREKLAEFFKQGFSPEGMRPEVVQPTLPVETPGMLSFGSSPQTHTPGMSSVFPRSSSTFASRPTGTFDAAAARPSTLAPGYSGAISDEDHSRAAAIAPHSAHAPMEPSLPSEVEHFRSGPATDEPTRPSYPGSFDRIPGPMSRPAAPSASSMPASRGAGAPAIQLHNSYLVAQSSDGLIIIDQHALHERIMYEELLGRISRGPLESQRLLIPEVIDVSTTQLELLQQIQPLLAKLGIEASPFGPTSVAVHSFPSFLEKLEPGTFVRELLERGEQELLDLHEEEVLHEVLDMMACKAAVKAGDPLTTQEIEALLARRELVDRSSNCPHGRPTTLRLSLRDLEKQFKRTGF